NSTHTTSPPELNTLAGSSLGGYVRTLQILGGSQEQPIRTHTEQTTSPRVPPQ
ncbi:unnamed protein product, partial [Adineta steineri]